MRSTQNQERSQKTVSSGESLQADPGRPGDDTATEAPIPGALDLQGRLPPGCLYQLTIKPGESPRIIWQRGTCGEGLTYQAGSCDTALAWREVVLEEDRPRVDVHWQALLNGTISTCVFRIRDADGSIRWLSNDGWPMQPSEDGTRVVYGVARDITSLVEAERSIRAQEVACQEVFSTIEEGVWQFYLDEDGRYRVKELNRAAEHMEGMSRHLAVGQRLDTVFPDLGAELDAVFRQVAARGEPAYLPATCWEREGTTRWRDGRVHRLPSDRILLVYRDITERVIAEQEQIEVEERLALACQGQSLGKLAGAVAHDFNNKLAPILGYAQLLQEELGRTHPSYPDLCEIEDAAVQAKELAKQLLDFSRRKLLDIRPIDLTTTVQEWRKMISRLLREDVELLVHDAPPAWIRADGTRIRQLLLDLAATANHALPQGGTVKLEVVSASSSDSTQGATVCLRASFAGKVVDHSLLTLDGESSISSSSGPLPLLNLDAIQEIVRQHDGTIVKTVSTSTRVTLDVQWHAVPAPEGEPKLNILAPDVRGAATILLVEDAASVREMAKRILESAGYVVLDAGDATSALAIAEEYDKPIHLLLADVVLPRGDGKSLSERLLEVRPNLRILYTSGHPRDLLHKLGVTEDPTRFLPKPFSARGLLRAVSKVIEG